MQGDLNDAGSRDMGGDTPKTTAPLAEPATQQSYQSSYVQVQLHMNSMKLVIP